MLVAIFSVVAPADVWGGCERHVCVYHSMFCEYTRHSSAVRHPANFWSNLPYLWNGIFLCRQGWVDARGRTARPFVLLDGVFGCVSLMHSLASFGWHGSNCTSVHFVDIGLMNCVICFFPVRFGAMALASLARSTDHAVSLGAAVAYLAACVALLHGALEMTPYYHNAFPTGRARSDLSIGEVAAIVAFPALYPLPSWLVVALRKRCGSSRAMLAAACLLPIGFSVQMAERWALDLFCDPASYVLQPTTVLHVATGLTISAAYVHARSVQDE